MSLRLGEFIKINKYYILIFLIPISLATGPAIPDILITLSSLIFLYEYHKTIFTKKFFSEKVVLAFLSFWIYFVLNSLLNDIEYIGKSIVFVRFFFLIFIFQLCLTDINKNKLLIKYWIYFLIFVLIITLLQRVDANYENIFGIRGNSHRLTLILHDKLAIGNYLIKIFPFMLVYFFVYEKKYFFCSILSIVFVFTVLISGERAASIILVVYLIMLMSLIKLRFALSTVLILILFIFFATNVDLSIYKESATNYRLDRFYFILEIIKQPSLYLESPWGQLNFAGLHLFKNNYLFGIGPNSFEYVCNSILKINFDIVCSTHPHNYLIELLSSIGILGAFLFLLLAFLIVKKGIELNSNQKFMQQCFLIQIIAIFWPLVPTMSILNNWNLSIAFFGLSLIFFRIKDER